MRDSVYAGDQEQLATVTQAGDTPDEELTPQGNTLPRANHATDLDSAHKQTATKSPMTSSATSARESASHGKQPTAVAPLSASVQSHIGAQMQSFYNDLLKEETPERFLKLLEELDRKSSSR